MGNLPSLKGLRAFEAAARTGSFAAAADELKVSPAAIGQLIRALEEQVGRKLFHRVHRGITPTEAGLEVLPRLSLAFDELEGVAQQISGGNARARLTVSAPMSVVSGWLSRRLDKFIALHGPTDIFLRTDADPVNFEHEMIDVRMSYGRFHYRTRDTEEIAVDAVYAVCAPDLLVQYGPVLSTKCLQKLPLIHTDWGPSSASFSTWRDWFEAAGAAPDQSMNHGMIANSSIAALNLAVSGLGVALCQGLLAERFIEQGMLVRAHGLALPQNHPYCLTIPRRRAKRPIVMAFKNWFAAECIATTTSPHLLS